jgi:hypothetical protein
VSRPPYVPPTYRPVLILNGVPVLWRDFVLSGGPPAVVEIVRRDGVMMRGWVTGEMVMALRPSGRRVYYLQADMEEAS